MERHRPKKLLDLVHAAIRLKQDFDVTGNTGSCSNGHAITVTGLDKVSSL